MISVINYLKTGSSPLQTKWATEYTREDIREDCHRFDFNLFPRDEEGLADRLHAEIIQDAFSFRNVNRPPKRAPTKKVTQKFSNKVFDLCLLVLGNGIFASDKGQAVSISLSGRQEVSQISNFNKEDVRAVIEAMESNGYFEVLLGGQEYFDGNFYKIATRLIPLQKFSNLRCEVGPLKEDAKRKGVVKLRMTKKERVYVSGAWANKKSKVNLPIKGDYSDLADRVVAINEFNNRYTLSGDNVDANGIISVPGSKRKVSANLNNYTAIHTNDLDHGGRLFAMSGIQSLPKSERAKLRWEGFSDAVVELDFSGMHPAFLAALAGEEVNRYAYDVGDVLGVGHEAAIAIVKLTFNTCLNSSSKRQSTGAIRGRVQDDLDILIDAMKVEKVRKAIIKAFPWVEQYFYTGYGLRLMKLERDIALHVIENMHGKGVPCLTMHDSFLVPAEFEEELAYEMKFWAAHVTGGEAGRDVSFDHFKVK